MTCPFRYFKTSPEIIRLAVMLYVRFPLSLRNVEDLLHERRFNIGHETVRYWWKRLGPLFAAEIRKRRAADLAQGTQWQWHVDEMFVRINGVRHYLWRAVDYEGEVLEVYVSKRRDRRAAVKFLRKLMKGYGRPKRLVNNSMSSYRSALKVLGAAEILRTGRYQNNRAENSHLPVRRRERAMLKFRRAPTPQKFSSVHASIHNHLDPQRSLPSRPVFKWRRASDWGGRRGMSYHWHGETETGSSSSERSLRR